MLGSLLNLASLNLIKRYNGLKEHINKLKFLSTTNLQ